MKIAEIDLARHLEEEFKSIYTIISEDFVLVGIDKGETIEVIEKLIDKTKISYPICLDRKSEIFEFSSI